MATTKRGIGASLIMNEQFLAKYPQVVRLLERDNLILEIRAATGVCRQTIRRVRMAM